MADFDGKVVQITGAASGFGALAATSGAGLWAAAGGLIGWTLSLVPFLAFGAALADQAAARIARLMSAAILTLWGLNAAMRAFGL